MEDAAADHHENNDKSDKAAGSRHGIVTENCVPFWIDVRVATHTTSAYFELRSAVWAFVPGEPPFGG
jgi:hypothetical protein